MKKTLRLLILLIAIVFLYGCVAALIGVGAGVGIGTYKYIEGNLIRVYPLAYTRAWDVSNTTMADLKISITSSSNEGDKGAIEGVRQNGSKIMVKLKDKGQNVTSIAIRAGILGDRDTAEKIHDKIAGTAGL